MTRIISQVIESLYHAKRTLSYRPTPAIEVLQSRLQEEGIQFRHLNRDLKRHSFPSTIRLPYLLEDHSGMVGELLYELDQFPKNSDPRFIDEERREKLIGTLSRTIVDNW